jgi:hypothetical protein
VAEPRARVAFAKVRLADELTLAHPDSAAPLFVESLVPGTRAVRYGREWRMGQWKQANGLVQGRIGFVTEAAVTEVWNESINDFEPHFYRTGATSPFVARLADLRIAFQLRSNIIRPTSFTKALQALLNEASSMVRWQVDHDVRGIPWAQWLEQVERVTKIHVRLERPNPNYHGRKRVEEIIEGTRAKLLELTATAREDAPGLNLDDEFILQVIEHAAEFGKYTAQGQIIEHGRERTVQWRSDVEGAPPERIVPADIETREASHEVLAQALEDEVPQEDSR